MAKSVGAATAPKKADKTTKSASNAQGKKRNIAKTTEPQTARSQVAKFREDGDDWADVIAKES
jgi:hypothetical protein